MHKLIIMIETPEDSLEFDESWPLFLRQAERMPGLVREATIRVSESLFGGYDLYMIHELYFDSLEVLQDSMISPHGKASGQILQRITGGRMALLLAEHREDNMENIKKYQIEETDADTG